MIHKSLTELVGKTPLLEIAGLPGQKARIAVKLESFNPGGSVKDRVALAMIEDAENRNILKPGSVIIEPTSGNTGIGLAWVAVAKGYKASLTMPDTMSIERRRLLKAYGAQLELTPGAEGMKGAIRRAEELRDEIPGAVILGQFTNPANPRIHAETTAEEIWADTEGEVDILVSGVGTGGTVSGTALRLKEHKAGIRAIAVEPALSPVLSGGNPGKHRIQGIGAGFIPDNYNPNVIDGIERVSDEDAIGAARILAQRGILVGISSGAAFYAASLLAAKEENSGKLIVAILPDTGERYLSTGIFD